ncbi:hypothetical protein [Antrihabitans sp. YC2-6]|uniref:hypothetical protein n=1 Tax=Antrihabitans sp. YC2-6 TaxID=2799498 RepID=UPI0018F29085|nr:hypothetical protein [Antrihabitans sp. YC2-6]MBJ8348838.1 hypothetical protein [Antrihabitans sp. YC2-6]
MVAYDNEDHLQGIIADAPSRVPGVPDGALTVREFSTSAGPADVCIVSPDGSITVVECKLASNSERRRMVIGQVIDYASAICVDGEATFREQWTRQRGADLAAFGEGAVEQLGRNIADGRIHLCLAVDQIDGELRRLVEYMNRITRDEITVTAVQLAYARHGTLEILIPSTYGGEIAAIKARESGQSSAWTKDSFIESIGSTSDRDIALRIFEQLEAIDERRGTHDDLLFGKRPSGGIFIYPYGLRYAPIQLWINKSGHLMAYGTWNQYTPIQHHDGYAKLALLAGLDHKSSAKGFRLADIDVDMFWAEVLRCAERINSPATEQLP